MRNLLGAFLIGMRTHPCPNNAFGCFIMAFFMPRSHHASPVPLHPAVPCEPLPLCTQILMAPCIAPVVYDPHLPIFLCRCSCRYRFCTRFNADSRRLPAL